MRPLNRPMFRYGGPIKEGVMSGIREPKKDGGPAGMGLVGDQRYPKTNGREHHAFFLAAPAAYTAARMAAMRAAPVAARYAKQGLGAIKNFFRTQTGTKTVPKSGPTFPGRTTTSQGGFGAPVTTRTGTPISAGTAQVPVYAPSYLGRDPTVRLVGGAYKAVTNPKVTGMAGKAARVVFSPTGALTGLYFANGKFFNKDNIEVPPPPNADKLILGDKVGTSGAPGGGDPNMFAASKGAGSGVELSPKEKRASQVEKYRDIMDIKGMNKEAAYDSLIAASQAVNQAGGDLKGAIKDGSLINQIIQSTSKAFDKPKKTKDAIDTLILKGEIEKDIKASDPSAKLLNQYRLKQMEKIDKDLNTGFAEAKIAASKNLSGQAAIDAAASVASNNYKGNIITKSQLTDVMEAAKGSGEISEEQIIISATQEVIKGKNLPDGDYTVGDVLVTITEGQVTDIKR